MIRKIELGEELRTKSGTVFICAAPTQIDSLQDKIVCFGTKAGTYVQVPFSIVVMKKEELKVGDKVRAIQYGNRGFTGIVTAIEEETGRLICKSDRSSESDRTRWAYLPNELEKIQYVTFKHGEVISVNFAGMIVPVMVKKDLRTGLFKFMVTMPDGILDLGVTADNTSYASYDDVIKVLTSKVQSAYDKGILTNTLGC